MLKKIALGVLILIIGAFSWFCYYNFFAPSNAASRKVLNTGYLYLKTGSQFNDLVSALQTQGFINDTASFVKLAKNSHFDTLKVRPGRFKLSDKLQLNQLIDTLKVTPNVPVVLVLHDFRYKEQVAGYMGRLLECDSVAIATAMNDTLALAKDGFTPENLMAAFIPNSYHVYWNSSPTDIIQRMLREHKRFWNETRLAKAKKLALSTKEIYTLASIVEKETLQDSEKQRMAGVYLNRVRQKMKLQADPTVLFAHHDFTIKIPNGEQLKLDSPYNTYKYVGLPPGPIYMASIASIDAVLDAEKHKFLYFCAKGDASGLHNYAKTFDEHKKNVALYRKNKGI